jgi:hypothetical protein
MLKSWLGRKRAAAQTGTGRYNDGPGRPEAAGERKGPQRPTAEVEIISKEENERVPLEPTAATVPAGGVRAAAEGTSARRPTSKKQMRKLARQLRGTFSKPKVVPSSYNIESPIVYEGRAL